MDPNQTPKHAEVGDIVKVKNYECIPADLLILRSSIEDSGGKECYVETKSLDGETNLKMKIAKR